MPKISETETVIKKIIPYLVRRGYDVDKDMGFEYPSPDSARGKLGFVDIRVLHNGKTAFLIEAKRMAKPLAEKDRAQAINYGRDCKAPFVVLTNGAQFECLNPVTGRRIQWSSRLTDKIPSKEELPGALTKLRKEPDLQNVELADKDSLPFRPGLPLKQLNALFGRCHGIIRKIERNEDHAFSDFAKLLFLKLLEEKADTEGSKLPYTFRFYELAEKSEAEADQVKTAIRSMIDSVKKNTPYGDVIEEELHLKNAKTFRRLVIELAAVSFWDTGADSKGAAFEYFVRATLKGKKLGQYFTPRPVVELMQCLVGEEKILTTLGHSGSMRVVDPACGTGGFLVWLMTTAVSQANQLASAGKINAARREELVDKIKRQVFFGSDAHQGVAASAKMNMIIAGDGHSNITCEDSLSRDATIWSVNKPDIDLIVTNPPFGTSESESLTDADRDQFPVGSSKGQILFIQKMVQALKPGGEICTVIDEGILNTDQAADLRAYIMEHMTVRGIVRLPDVTFKPNKINVKSSILHLEKRMTPRPDLDDDYPVLFVDVENLGYQGSGEAIRNFALRPMLDQLSTGYHGVLRSASNVEGMSPGWTWFTRSSLDLASDEHKRFDLKYWNKATTDRIEAIRAKGAKAVSEINAIKTRRGKSPSAALYVDEADGHAIVIKAGSNITRRGEILFEGDFIEKSLYDEMTSVHVLDGDILVSSTGDGTLGKCAVYRGNRPAIIDGHVALVRVDQTKIYPEYVADYIRAGFGAEQVRRLFTGSTGLIELPPEKVDQILVPLPDIKKQKAASSALRLAEQAREAAVASADASLETEAKSFRSL